MHHLWRNIMHCIIPPKGQLVSPRISLWSQSFEVPTMTLDKQTVQHIASSTQTQRASEVGESPQCWGLDHPGFFIQISKCFEDQCKSTKYLMFVLSSWAREWFVGPLDIPIMHPLCYIKPMLLQNTRWTGRCQCCVWKGSRHSHNFWLCFIRLHNKSDWLALSSCGKSSNVRAGGMLREGLKELKLEQYTLCDSTVISPLEFFGKAV